VKIHHHGQVEQSGRKEKSDQAVQIAWNPVVKKLTGVGDKKFKRKKSLINSVMKWIDHLLYVLNKDTAEEYERAPGFDAVDYFIDDELPGSQRGKGFRKSGDDVAKIGSFIINVPDPLSAASEDNFDGNHPLTPLSLQEQDAINNLRENSKRWNTEQLVNICLTYFFVTKVYFSSE
jgi:hypothetical protein